MTASEILTRLAVPIDPADVRFKPAVVSGNRALALHYIDARAVQDRLDDVLGIDGWEDDYEVLPDGSVMCRLRVKIGDQWLMKVDVGSPSEQPDGGDRLKAAFSDGLKRAAVKFGIGRYLYRLPSQWVDWDPQRKQFVRPPALGAPPQAKLQPVPAKDPVIDDEERRQLSEALANAGKSVESALTWIGHKGSVQDLRVSQYRKLIAALQPGKKQGAGTLHKPPAA
jgi:hypothetical protein